MLSWEKAVIANDNAVDARVVHENLRLDAIAEYIDCAPGLLLVPDNLVNGAQPDGHSVAYTLVGSEQETRSVLSMRIGGKVGDEEGWSLSAGSFNSVYLRYSFHHQTSSRQSL